MNMLPSAPISHTHLATRRRALGLTFPALAARSGVSEPTVKRILGGHLEEASFANVAAVAAALGAAIVVDEVDTDDLLRAQARAKAEEVARLVQGTSALESQAVDADSYRRLVERSYHELMAGSRRRLWGD